MRMRVRRMSAVLKVTSPSLWRRWRLFGTWMKSLFSSIGMRLVMVVLVTGVLAFATIGSLTMFRLQAGLKEQAHGARRIVGAPDGSPSRQ